MLIRTTMNLDILSVNLIVYVSMVFTALSYYVLFTLFKNQTPKRRKKKKTKSKFLEPKLLMIAGVVPVSLILALIIRAIAGHETDSYIPGSLIIMCLPFTALVYFLVLALFVKKKVRIVAIFAAALGLLFSGMLINDYYRYYPTLGEVFGKNSIHYQNNSVTIHYNLNDKQTSYNDQSVQASLAALSSAPTSGNLYKINIPGTVSKFKARPGYVYVPAIYSALPQINLPVIVLTAGVPGTPDNWAGLGLKNIMDQFALSHRGITPLVVVADSTGSVTNDTECVNSPRGNVETYLTVDVPNYIKKNYHVDSQPKNWAIGGLSLGGMCSVMLTLRHPNVYNYFIDLGGEIGPEIGSKEKTIDTLFGGSEQAWEQHQPSLLMAAKKYPGLGGFFGYGGEDTLDVTSGIAQLYLESKTAGLDTVKEMVNGQHTFDVWAQTYKDSMPWISNRIGATTCSASCF